MSEDKKAFANFITDPSASADLRVSVQVAMTMVEWERFKRALDKTCENGTVEDFKRLCVATGFADPRVASSAPIAVTDEALRATLGEAQFFSITYRLFKLPEGRLESLCEDYGQFAVYKGTILGAPHAYSLDDHHRLLKGKPFLVCGNSAAMLQETWLGKHFDVHGDRSTHYGLFPCGPAPAASAGAAACAPGGACC